MIEISIEDFEVFYKERLDTLYFKLKRVVKKQITDIKENLIEMKVCMDHFLESGEEKIDEKALKSLHFFSDRIRKEIDEIEIPEDDMMYDNLTTLLNSIKKLFNNINEIAKKSLPKFQKQVQSEIKELNYITRKLNKKQSILDDFLRKKYTELKDAEYQLKRLPKLFTLRENIEHAKIGLDQFEKELSEREKTQEELNESLLSLERNELFKELDVLQDKMFKLRIKINDQLGFKKALKKLKFELDKETIHVSNINSNYLRDFLKNPIATLNNERSDLPDFTSLLVHLRHVLEDNKLNLKTETKEKTIELINHIFDEKLINDDIERLKELNKEIEAVQEKIEQAGLAAKLEEIKNHISTNTAKLEHIQNDMGRKNKDYLRYLSSLKNERVEFQDAIESVLGEEIKLNITFSF